MVTVAERGFAAACHAGLLAATRQLLRVTALHGRLGNALFVRELRRSGVLVHDLGPMRDARRQPLVDLELIDRRSGHALEIVAAAGAAGWRATEVDVATRRAPAVRRSPGPSAAP